MWIITGFASFYAYGQQAKADLKVKEQAIRAVSMKWLELWEKHDLAGSATLFANDAVVYRENQKPATGPAAIQEAFKKEFMENAKASLSWTTDRVDVSLSGDLTVEYGSYTEPTGGMNGNVPGHGRYITVYRKINGAWKVLSDCSISKKPK